MSHQESSSKAIFYALVANLGIAIAKSVAAFLTGSGSMLAEAVHSFADCGNQLLLFFGLHRSKMPPTREHPLGFGKVVYFWSFLVAILLFSVGGLFSVQEGIHKLVHPEPLQHVPIAIGVLFFSAALESFSMYGCIREINKIKGRKTFWQWLKSSRNAEFIVVLGEDTAALIGLVVALFFIVLSYITNNPVFDALGSLVIGVILVIVAFFISMRVKALMVGMSADPELEDRIESLIEKDKAIVRVFNIITQQFGPHLMLAAKIEMKPDLTIKKASIKINELEKNLKAEFPEIRWCFIEPDVAK
ncbi:MAG: cation diffusion facilitator family transporter [Spirochaetia bacterium]|nr:cation diffusion facilitator family transporter [Spirochaetia bacterium]